MSKSKNALWLRMSGSCGTIAPILAFAFIFLAVASYPQFSWVDNALSDLGVVQGVTAAIFNSGLIVSGVLCFIFATGLFIVLGESVLGRVGALVFALACLALVAIGVFNESFGLTHFLVSVAFFLLLPVSLLIIVGAFWRMSQVRMAAFTLLVAVVAAAPWVLLFSVRYVSGVAIPEFMSALAGAVWAMVLGYKMLREASRSKAL